jgi:hypothetical protein
MTPKHFPFSSSVSQAFSALLPVHFPVKEIAFAPVHNTAAPLENGIKFVKEGIPLGFGLVPAAT